MRVHECMLNDHVRITALLRQLKSASEVSDNAELPELFQMVDRAIRSHFDYEEKHLLPLLGRKWPELRQQLGDEHREIRRWLDELGIGIELHIVRKEQIDGLITRLEEHADREDAALYRWVDERPDALPGWAGRIL